MNLYKVIICVATILYALFIFTYPASYFNDDALFLARGIDNFSVIDFSPHFPGYPFIILAGKFINLFVHDSQFSLFILTSFCAIFLPLVLFLYVKSLINEKVAFYAFLLALSSPYLVNLSLSMLSDSVGLFFLFLGLYLLQINRHKGAGIVLSIAFFSRPSYIIFYLVGFLYLLVVKKESLKPLLSWFFITSLVFITYLFLSNGMLYWYEAQRFITGHFSLWGTGQNSPITWVDNIFTVANIPFLLLGYSFYKYEKKFNLLVLLFCAYLVWILLAQNPDNIRHLIPLIFIATILIAKVLENFKSFVILMIIFNVYTLSVYTQKLSPIDQIMQEIDDKERIVLSNRSIEILRKNLTNGISDSYYINNTNYLLTNKKTYHITTIKPENGVFMAFNGRFIGEHTFYLLKN